MTDNTENLNDSENFQETLEQVPEEIEIPGNPKESETGDNPEDLEIPGEFSESSENQEIQDSPVSQETPEIPDEPVLTFYKYDSDGFYLGTTWKQEENTTDIPFTFEPGYWFFFRDNQWEKVKIPETVQELDFDITLTDESTNYQKTLVSLAQRLFAEYTGNTYKLEIQESRFKVSQKSLEELKNEKLDEISNYANRFEQNKCDEMFITSSLGFRANADRRSLQNVENLIRIGQNTVFKDYDNLFHTITVQDLETLALEISTNGSNLYNQKFQMQMTVMNFTTIQELENFEIQFTMMDFSASDASDASDGENE